MQIGVIRETADGEHRVALLPDTAGRMVKGGLSVMVERGAGTMAGAPDAAYEAAGAALAADAAGVLGGSDVVLKVQRPTPDESALIREGSVLVSFLQPSSAGDLLPALAARKIVTFAMELVPRTTRAQSMDALSSQATVAGYKAVLIGASRLGKLLPMLTTAAGTLPPARAFILGAGVAGLQAIATARRLGAVVSAFDVRPVVKEQVESLGAKFVESDVTAVGEGGYAKELGADDRARAGALIHETLKAMDLVVTTAQIPGRPAPELITGEMVRDMAPGAVIVDLAAESGGNCALTEPGATVTKHGVHIIGAVNLPATVPFHASQMYGRNLQTFVDYIVKDGKLAIDLDDPIMGPMCLTHGGSVLSERMAG
ncbi:MAG: Re/Si-specific NAD(P)(+) transhydrogenase subunit alpha [Gemmatimonadales bacterium]